MKVVIFGVGNFYKKRVKEVSDLLIDDEIVAFLDNRFENQGDFNGIPAMNPSLINMVKYDCIIIMSIYVEEIYNQLCSLGVDKERIYTLKQYRSWKTGGELEKYDSAIPGDGKKVLIVTNPIRYDGGSMAAVYAAMALRQRGYCVWVTAEYVESELQEKLLRDGISIAINRDIPYWGETIKKYMDSFSVVLVNVFPNIHSAYDLGKIKPVVWWLHESDIYGKIYQQTFELFPEYREKLEIETVNIVAVSDKAKGNFQRYYPEIDVRLMPYGLPDDVIINEFENNTMIFALIGNISYLKGQDIFIDAAIKVMNGQCEHIEFWLIGSTAGDYAQNFLLGVEQLDYVKVKGEVNRAEMRRLLSEIDVVVSASREDSLPIVITEGMMNSKTCIISDAIGSSKYIKNMVNGIKFKSQDADDLAKAMTWCLNNKDALKVIGSKARNTYKEFFSMKAFADNLEKEILYAEMKYNARKANNNL